MQTTNLTPRESRKLFVEWLLKWSSLPKVPLYIRSELKKQLVKKFEEQTGIQYSA